ncbi:hypothetical protein TWF106_011229 [Orbilia oligospora]|uniref:RNase III domain-containing protein n=1 Tax=Orbilia oligospora TaxID=2813651 RepID=A0A6G1MGY3_ORBOL|nr:hypothetical protein TWF788_004482 [Orbilia oligospora]KAF3202316.1 hypothetical protein TWF679_010873 [Orbilia oligospora]KAF3226817.1 hypothetical protein TWF106_011229 [Orbilia oligospora]KAF3229535.1 hypothetical protein TWF191_001257 [Orbilia oligospora]KAF3258319.1 hypothetical protein TWF192_000450 [Orbilia oligospora]
MASSRSCLRPVLSSSRQSRTICAQCSSTPRPHTLPTNHQRSSPSTGLSNRQFHASASPAISRPLQQVQQQPVPPQINTPPAGYRMNKITRPFVPVATHMRVPFAVNTSLDVLNDMYNKLLGEGGANALTDDIKWQCVTHKSFDHGLQPYNTKLAFYGRRIAYLHTTLSMIHQPVAPTPQPNAIIAGSGEPEISNDPTLKLPVIARRNPVNRVSYMSVQNHLSSTNLYGIAQASGMVPCLRWKPRNPANLTDSGVIKVAEDTIMAILGAVALQKGGDAARVIMEERILSAARTITRLTEERR